VVQAVAGSSPVAHPSRSAGSSRLSGARLVRSPGPHLESSERYGFVDRVIGAVWAWGYWGWLGQGIAVGIERTMAHGDRGHPYRLDARLRGPRRRHPSRLSDGTVGKPDAKASRWWVFLRRFSPVIWTTSLIWDRRYRPPSTSAARGRDCRTRHVYSRTEAALIEGDVACAGNDALREDEFPSTGSSAGSQRYTAVHDEGHFLRRRPFHAGGNDLNQRVDDVRLVGHYVACQDAPHSHEKCALEDRRFLH
jgi:hypothetical protein